MAQRTLNILIADDDERDRKQLRRALEQAGLSCECVETGSIDEALEACDKCVFDCAIVDYRMPGYDGLHGIAALHQRLPHMSIIMATGQGDDRVAAEAMKRGASDYIPKSQINRASIRRVIENAVEKATLQRKAAQQREDALRRGTYRIMIVDDDEGDRKQVRRALERAGLSCECVEIASIEGALEACEKRAFDCAFIDYRMPGHDGLHGIAALCERFPYMPIIMFAGKGDEIIATEAMKLGASDYIPKMHIHAKSIRRVIENALEKATLRRKVAEQREDALRRFAEREQLFIAAVESSNDAIVTEALDGVITGWNSAAERLFGFTEQEAMGQSIDIIVPDDLHVEVRDVLDKIRRGEKVDDHETARKSKDGRPVDISLSLSPIKTPAGVIIGAANVARDITERRKAQQALLESEQMARGIIAQALEAFIQLDEGGHVLEWNPQAEAVFGWTREEAVGRPLRNLFLPNDFGPRYLELRARIQNGDENATAGERFELDAVRKDGQKIRIEVSLTALRRRTGLVFNSFVRDLTERIAAEEKLRQSQKMEAVGQLTGGIAHDFNNMLTVITCAADILAEAVADRPDLAAILKPINVAADRCTDLTGRLLAFASRQSLQPRTTDINALIRESVNLMRPTLGEQVEIEPVLQKDVWTALVDPSQLSTALLNLALNARDAMPNGGRLTLKTANVVFDEDAAKLNGDVRAGNYVMIAVDDTGTGIPEAIREKVFEPFFSTKGVGKGTGLGLSMVYGFIKQSNGHIKVYSEEGHGTTFTVFLPQADDTRSEQCTDVTAEDLVKGENETILVVEDDPLVRTHVTTQLHGFGYRTISAANATEAIAVVDSGAAFDLLFTDVIMPGPMNGRQLAEEVAKRHSPLKVLFTSGYTEDAVVHRGRLDHGVLLLAKPYRKAQLAHMIRVALDASPGLHGDGIPGMNAKWSERLWRKDASTT